MRLKVAVITCWGVLIGLLPPIFQMHLLRIASPGREAASGAIAITVLNLGIASGATLGGAVLGIWQAGALPAVAAVIMAVATAGLIVNGLRDRRATGAKDKQTAAAVRAAAPDRSDVDDPGDEQKAAAVRAGDVRS